VSEVSDDSDHVTCLDAEPRGFENENATPTGADRTYSDTAA